ncbi:MAG: B12-binding domain-containing radical SAM protein [Desulfobacula sp.]|nr:B12-binding domain-containing radical SAM protein [Desulfobacula sp.]
MKKRFKATKDNGSKANVEQGAIIKKGRGLIKAALVYPNTYEAGMSSLGFQTVYKIANQIDNVACERVFWQGNAKTTGKYRPTNHQTGKHESGKLIKSRESGLRLNQFDIILFSISFENDFINLVQLLGETGIPLRSPDRNHTHPLVVAGGVACFLNPEPIAPFIDSFLLGEAECLLSPFFNAFSKMTDKDSFLSSLEITLPGAYVPALHTDKKPFEIKVQYIKDLKKTTTQSIILSSHTAFKNTFLVETLKGCPHGCRFCSAGFIYRPPRIYPVENILAAIDEAKTKTNRLGLVSSAVADHPQIEEICNYALEKEFRISFSSLRADKLSEKLMGILSRSSVKTATIAPEAGSERMRAIINKKITEQEILLAAKKLVDAGILNIKLYFMIGLPFEYDEDVSAIVELTKKIKSVFLEASRKKKKIGTVTLSINPFIPKPATPFQWSKMDSEKQLKAKVKIIREGLKKTANVRINTESLRKAKIHALLSLGDQKMANLIENAMINGWSFAVRQNSTYCNDLIYKEKNPEGPLPWDFLNNRINKQFLAEEYEKARLEKKSGSCPMIDCNKCKICIKNN